MSLPNIPVGTEHPPTHLDLMNCIAASIPTRWRDVGLQLGLRTADLDAIEVQHGSDCNRSFSCVFSTWENQLTKPFTWHTLLQALTSPLVAENRLAQQTRNSLIQDTPIENAWYDNACMQLASSCRACAYACMH
jgi:hypothetical protein